LVLSLIVLVFFASQIWSQGSGHCSLVFVRCRQQLMFFLPEDLSLRSLVLLRELTGRTSVLRPVR
jgi:hypothetical protein